MYLIYLGDKANIRKEGQEGMSVERVPDSTEGDWSLAPGETPEARVKHIPQSFREPE